MTHDCWAVRRAGAVLLDALGVPFLLGTEAEADALAAELGGEAVRVAVEVRPT